MISNDSFKKFELIKLKVPTKEELASKSPSEYNEKEKMVSGLPYNAFGQELVNARMFSQAMCYKLNQSSPFDIEARFDTLGQLLGTYNKNIIEPPFHCDYGANIHFDEGAYANFGCIMLDVAEIRVGKNTLFGPGVHVYTAGHPTDPIQRRYTEFGKPVRIGDDCWIGGNAIICPGVTIGDGILFYFYFSNFKF